MMQSIENIKVKGKRVLLRLDLNVPLKSNGDISDDFRIREALPTVQYLVGHGAKVVVMTHLGDPLGQFDEKLKTDKVAERLGSLLGVSVLKLNACVGEDIQARIRTMKEGDIIMLENLRFENGEEANNGDFATNLALLGDIFVNDAFSVCHRSHASVDALCKLLPSGAGFQLQREVYGLEKLLESPKRPMVAVIGGKKIDTKLPFIEKLLRVADEVLLGNILSDEAVRQGIVFSLPEKIIIPVDGFPSNDNALDIGPKTRKLFLEKISKAKTFVWTGPVGKYEEKEYSQGSIDIALAIRDKECFAVAGGGNLVDFLGRYKLQDKFDYISTGGGAMLAFLTGATLPGLQVLGYYNANKIN